MVGNVSGIVESYFAADNAKSHQNTTAAQTNSRFSDYLDYALLNSRTGLLFGNGIDSGYSYTNALTGSIWQSMVLKALKEELKKDSETEDTDAALKEAAKSEKTAEKKKPDWATIRVINRYKSPMEEAVGKEKGMLI